MYLVIRLPAWGVSKTFGSNGIAGTEAIDHLTGGLGAGTLVFADCHGNDHVTDFADGADLFRIERRQLSALSQDDVLFA